MSEHAELWQGLARNLIAGTRLSLFMPVRREEFRVSPGHYAMLVGTSLVAWLVGGLVRNGLPGEFNVGALVMGLGQLPLVLLACLLAASLLGDVALLLVFAVLITSTDPVFELVSIVLSRASSLESVADYGSLINEAYAAWGAIVLLRAQHVAAGWRGLRSIGAALLFLGLLAVFLFWFPRADLWTPLAEPSEEPAGLMREQVFHLQGGLLEDQIAELEPERPGLADLYFLGLATDASQDGYVNELGALRGVLEQRFDTADRTLVLANHAATLTQLPIASATNLAGALGELGDVINPEEDVVMLFLAGRATPTLELEFSMPPLVLDPINPTVLARLLADSGIKWRIIVVSACYSGGFIEPLRDDNSLIITSAATGEGGESCQAGAEASGFGRQFVQALGRTRSLTEAYSMTSGALSGKPGGDSGPQMHLGAAMKQKLEGLQRRLESTEPARPAVQASLDLSR